MPETKGISATATKVAITILAAGAALIHALYPWIVIDLTTAILILIAVLPWLATIVKSVELPGGFKIELQDVKAATDAIISAEAQTSTVKGVTRDSTAASERSASLQLLEDLALRDPSLALVAVRIEIEKRLRELAAAVGINAERKSAGYLLRELQRRDAIHPPEIAGGLNELIALGNQAAHGTEVSSNAATWVIDTTPFILTFLDAQIARERGSK